MKVTTDGCLFGAWVAREFQSHKLDHVLDIGTGTGLLSLMLAQKIGAHFDAVEADDAVCQEAVENFRSSPWAGNITGFHSKIQVFEPSIKYDLIVCNPPFFKKNQLGTDPLKNQAVHDEMLPMGELIEAVVRLLKPKGNLAIMYPPWEMKKFTELAQASGLFNNSNLEVKNQLESKVLRSICVFSRNMIQQSQSQLIIREDTEYTPDFLELIKDYYL